MKTIIRISTIVGLATIEGQGAHSARQVARAWLKKYGAGMGGGREAIIYVAVPGGRWHRLGTVGNPGDRSA